MTVYAIVNEKERNRFEREYQIPYGYYNCVLFFDLGEAIDLYDKIPIKIRKKLIIEKCSSGERKTVYERR
jgi:hypothetical protein